MTIDWKPPEDRSSSAIEPLPGRLAPPGRRVEPLQFNLRHLFWATLLICVFCAFARSTGVFVATLALGTYIVAALVALLRIEDLLVGGITAACLSTGLLIVAGFGFAPLFWMFVLGCIVYPVLGYVVGLVAVIQRQDLRDRCF